MLTCPHALTHSRKQVSAEAAARRNAAQVVAEGQYLILFVVAAVQNSALTGWSIPAQGVTKKNHTLVQQHGSGKLIVNPLTNDILQERKLRQGAQFVCAALLGLALRISK